MGNMFTDEAPSHARNEALSLLQGSVGELAVQKGEITAEQLCGMLRYKACFDFFEAKLDNNAEGMESAFRLLGAISAVQGRSADDLRNDVGLEGTLDLLSDKVRDVCAEYDVAGGLSESEKRRLEKACGTHFGVMPPRVVMV